MRRLVAVLLATLLPWAPVGSARADDDPVFVIEFKDGAIAPSELVVPADTRFKLELHNIGDSPV